MENRKTKLTRLAKEIVSSIVNHPKFTTESEGLAITVGSLASYIANLEIRIAELEDTLNKVLTASSKRHNSK